MFTDTESFEAQIEAVYRLTPFERSCIRAFHPTPTCEQSWPSVADALWYVLSDRCRKPFAPCPEPSRFRSRELPVLKADNYHDFSKKQKGNKYERYVQLIPLCGCVSSFFSWFRAADCIS